MTRAWLLVLLLAGAPDAAPAGRTPLDAAPRHDAAPGVARARELLAGGDAARARALLEDLALGGDAAAQEALAGLALDGITGPRDPARAMPWLCLLAHQPAGGAVVMRALWYLAEYHRTGGGVPGRRYDGRDRRREDPVKAYFWFRAMAEQRRLYREVLDDAATLGRLGASRVASQLLDGERQLAERRLERWSPADAPGAPQRCLELPRD